MKDPLEVVRELAKALEEKGYAVAPQFLQEGSVFEVPTELIQAQARGASEDELRQIFFKYYGWYPTNA